MNIQAHVLEESFIHSATLSIPHTQSHTHTHSLSHTQPITHAVWFLNDGLATSDQSPPLLVVLQVKRPAGGAILHWQRVGAYRQRLSLCVGDL